MTVIKEGWVSVDCNEKTRHYFDVLTHILPKVESLFKESSNLPDGLGIDNYIRLFNNSMQALALRYFFNGHEGIEDTEQLTINTTGSGFPIRKEFLYLNSMKENIEEEQARYPTCDELRQQILQHAMSKKEIPYRLQKDLSYVMYLDCVAAWDLFLPYNEPDWATIESGNGKTTILINWATFDIDRCIPVIYMMRVDMGMEEHYVDEYIRENSDAIKKMLKHNTSSSNTLLAMGKSFDKEFAKMHPKEIKRVHLGPIYCSGITEHNDEVESVLEKVSDTNDNWLFQWKVETLRSKSSEQQSAGFFSANQEMQIWDIPVHNPFCVDNGITSYDISMIIPYRAYQALADSGKNTLLSEKKFVIGDEGELIRL
ncbi:hypothetical protein LMH73_007550 [Vibrio splendidus]|nr:hypothetical protein [Vibrio splendidus]MCC4880384.1 hypothetical protein [Vibrio splendidus]